MNRRTLLALFSLCTLYACSAATPPVENAGPAPAIARPAPPSRAWSQNDLGRLRSILGNTLTSPAYRRVGIAVADDSGRVLYERNGRRALAPASSLKVFVAATSLATLGPNARFSTRFVSLDRPDADGQIDGLWLVGGGDPVLDPNQLRDGIATLYRAGVRRVAGDLLVDPRPFKEPEQNRGWAPDDFEYDYAAGTSIVSLNWNVIEFKVAPTKIGALARISISPADPSIVVHSQALTGYRNDLQVRRLSPGRNEFAIRGTVAGPGEQIFYRPVNGIPLWTGQVSAQMLRERGIAFTGNVDIGSNPLAEQVLWEHNSPPLRTLVRQMLVESDNHIAEQLLRILGTRAGDSLTVAGGSERAGGLVEEAYMRSMDVPMPELNIVDGSGLALGNRVAPITFVSLLQNAARTLGSDYVTAFARAGIEGTVRRHDLGVARGYVRAKSGHIGNVNTLVGFVQTRHHGRLAFAFMVNAPGADDMDSIEDSCDSALQGLYGL